MTTRTKQLVAFVLSFTMLIGLLQVHDYTVFAYTAQTGMIKSADKSMVTTRKKPLDTAGKVNNLVYGKPVTVVDEVTDADGKLWYKLTYELKAGGTSTGYCHAEDVLLDKDIEVFAFGVLNANNVSLRNDAGTDGTQILIALNVGDKVELLDETTVDGNGWYRVRYTKGSKIYVGWMRNKYIEIEKYNVETDPKFEKQLRDAGFPESYIYNLAVLHAFYPEWIFEPVMTGLDWKTVIAKETEKPLNMVSTSADDAKKSTAATEYDWNTNKWVIRDGDSWVAVHPDYLAYCMDPRNFLTEQYIFQFESLSYSELHTIEGVQAVIGSSFMKDDIEDTDGTILNYAQAFMEIGKQVGVSPYHLASRVRQEQGNKGTSSLISGKYKGYEGYFNYFNFGAYGESSTAVIKAGLKYAKNKGWDTRYKSLLGGSSSIAKNYIGKGQDTLYFQKFNVVYQDKLYNHQYMSNVDAARQEAKSIAAAYTDKHQAFVFRIPVYENMPEEAVQFKVSGNRNNYLKDLSVSGLSLTPTFTGSTKAYTLIVPSAVSSIDVEATPVVAESTITGTGTRKLKIGTNTIKIKCKSESGTTRTYTLTVVRPEEDSELPEDTQTPETENPGTQEPGTQEPGTQEPGTQEPGTQEPETQEPETQEPETQEPETQEPEVVPSVTSDKYKMDKYITGIKPGTKAAAFLKGFTCVNAEIKLLNAKGKENKEVVATGDVLAMYVGGELVKTYEIVITGDVNGDGKISMADLVKINRHILGLAKLKDVYLEAGDVNHKGDGISMADLVITNRHLLNLTTITQ